MMNLDYFAADAAQQMITAAFNAVNNKDEIENLVKKTLGIVQEAGVYASTVFLCARAAKTTSDGQPKPEARVAMAMREGLLNLANRVLPPDSQVVVTVAPASLLAAVASRICQDLDRVLLVKRLWEQSLIYARYGAQSLG